MDTLGIASGGFPYSYLGVLIFRGTLKARHLQPITDFGKHVSRHIKEGVYKDRRIQLFPNQHHPLIRRSENIPSQFCEVS